MDFFTVGMREIERGPDKGRFEIFPDFVVGRSKDLMVRGRAFYAVWDEEVGLWSTDEYDVQRLVDDALNRYAEDLKKQGTDVKIKYLRSAANGGWYQFRKFVQNISDNAKELDAELTFANTEVKKSDYVSRRLSYPLTPGDYGAWDELVGTLYSPEERAKIEWAIGAIVAGDAKKIQKFIVFYGPGGTGKSTVMNIIEKLFHGYTTTFEAKALASNNGAFATEVFKNNPLVAIQQDGDLSKMEDNSKLNSIISHEDMTMNEKYKPSYTSRVNAFLFMGTNQPVKISDAKSGIIRRLIDVHPTGNLIPPNHYHTLMSQIDFELGAIAQHCLDVYRSMGKNYYNGYQPTEMMLQTDVFFNYIEAHYDIFKAQDGVTLRQAYTLYKEFCMETGIDRMLPQYKVREELRNYFDDFKDRVTIEGETFRSYYVGFNADKFKTQIKDNGNKIFSLVLEETKSLFDLEYAEQPAQGFRLTEDGMEIPAKRWIDVKTTLAEIDTSELHYVRVPEEHIVIDFDIRGENGEKSLEKNLEAASAWPPTYAELSKGGNGVHLHYNYTGDNLTELAQNYSEGIEVKTLLGDASLRRRLTKCNNVPVASINSGLPVKEKKVIPTQTIKDERKLREMIGRCLEKEFSPGTKSAVDFIKHLLDEAYDSGMAFDVTDLRPRILAFANGSSNQPLQSLKIVQQMRWTGAETIEDLQERGSAFVKPKDDRVAFFDVEVFPNLFVICWKFEGSSNMVPMINPTPQEVEGLLKLKLVGFNCRRYDNHILYARFMGYSNEQLYRLSQKIIGGSVGAMFGEAYGLSYADIYDFSSKKQGLKRFMVDLGLKHLEMDIPWDQPVPDELIPKVVEYCGNDVNGTEATFNERKADFVARQILAELSGLTVNDTTQRHTAKIIFGNDRQPQSKFVYTDLSKEFPGYEYDFGKSTYRGEITGEGGLVRAKPGMYTNVALLDVASMHPTSIIQLNLFGEYTSRFADLLNARLAIKHKDYDAARTMLDGRLAPYLVDETQAEALSYALKIVINIVYGLTSAKFDNPFRDPRNKDNIVAKRGALFMLDLKAFVEEQGYTVAHIKTDSIKIPDATPEIIDQVMRFGEKYGYDFEHESTYDRFCLVNDAVYIAGELIPDSHEPTYNDQGIRVNRYKWTAVGAQFQHPYVYKTLFTNEKPTFDDMCETKQVIQGVMYLDFQSVRQPMYEDRGIEGMQFIGRIGRFVPVTPESGGGILYRVKDDKKYAVTGTKGYFWMESEIARKLGRDIDIDMSYFEDLTTDALKTIEKFGSYEAFVS